MIDSLNELDELLSVIFVVYGNEGARVLFRYPPGVDNRNEDSSQPTGCHIISILSGKHNVKVFFHNNNLSSCNRDNYYYIIYYNMVIV